VLHSNRIGRAPSKINRASNHAILITLGFVLLGCQRPASVIPENVTSKSSEKPSSATVTHSEVSDASSASQSTASAALPQTVLSTVVAPVLIAIDSQPTAPEPAAKKPMAAPSADQISRWGVSVFEPLQLIGLREWEKSGQVNTTSLGQDNQHYLLAGTKLCLWKLADSQPKHEFKSAQPKNDESSYRSIATSPDRTWFATGDSIGTLQTWSINERRELTAKKIYTNGVTQVSISPDGQEIATMNFTSEVSIWDAATLAPKTQFKIETSGLKSILFVAPDWIVGAGEKTLMYRMSTGKLEQTLSQGRYHFSLATSLDGKRVAFGDEKGLGLWDLAESKLIDTVDCGIGQDEIMAFSPDGQHIVIAGKYLIRILDLSNKQTVQVIDTFGWSIVGLNWLAESNALLVTNELGQTRIWGGSSTFNGLSMKPLEVPVEMPETASRTPATSAQIMQTMDVRSFPKLPKSIVGVGDETSIQMSSTCSLDEAKAFYRYHLEKEGWTGLAEDAMAPGQDRYRKNGMLLSVSFTPAGSNVEIGLSHLGNYDLRWAPKIDVAETKVLFENELVSMYTTKGTLSQLEINLLRRMHAAGWTAYSRLNASHHESDDSRSIEFIQNRIVIRSSITKSPTDPDAMMVQSTTSLNVYSIPIPADSGWVEFDGTRQPSLVANTSMHLSEATSFYDGEMKSQGWLARERGRSVKDEYVWLAYSRGQQDISISLVDQKLERTSWQLAKPTEPDSLNKVLGIEAIDFPILSKSWEVKLDSNDKSIEINMGQVALADVADKVSAHMSTLGWKTQGSGVRSDDYTFITFQKERLEIALRARLKEGNAIANIQGDGLLWTKEMSEKKAISYEAWLRKNKHPATLDLLNDFEASLR
jgi:WD40 repeat protein